MINKYKLVMVIDSQLIAVVFNSKKEADDVFKAIRESTTHVAAFPDFNLVVNVRKISFMQIVPYKLSESQEYSVVAKKYFENLVKQNTKDDFWRED